MPYTVRKIVRRCLSKLVVSLNELIEVLPQDGQCNRGSELQAFVYRLFMSYGCSLSDIKEELDEYPTPLNLEHLKNESKTLLNEFRDSRLGHHWCSCIEHENGLKNIAKYFMHHRRQISESEEKLFFYTLDKICIINDIIEGNAEKYWIELEYPEGLNINPFSNSSLPKELNTPQAYTLLNKAVEKGWVNDDYSPAISEPKMSILGSIIADSLRLSPKWGVLEGFWKINNLANKLSRAQSTKYYANTLKEMEAALISCKE